MKLISSNYQRALRMYPSARNNVHSILSMVECLQNANKGRSGVSFLIHTSRVVVHFNETLIIDN
jgi:hypothetical protein